MNIKKTGLLLCMLIVLLALLTGCGVDATPYENNDAENYTVSVKYDANGGTFTTNTSVIVDSYNLSQLNVNGKGMAEIALLSPDSSLRGNDAFTAVNSGYFLAGWYTQRTETTDDAGNQVYVYSGRWDFESGLLEVDPSGTYTSAEPVLTLYAAWVPMFEIEFYALDSGEHLGNLSFNPQEMDEILTPQWNSETGAIEMYKFPARSGYTYSGAYYDASGTEPVGTVVEHPGVVDYANGCAKNSTLKLYVEWQEGEWYHIYNVEQFLDNASVAGSYVIHADLDFTDEIWPSSLMYGNYTGTIEGNGHTFSNIEVTQTNNSKANAGLFGHLTESSAIYDLNLNNVTFTIKAGTRVAGTSYGLFAGSISSGSVISGVTIANGAIHIASDCYFGVDDYTIGLICGMGDISGIDASDITCQIVGEPTGLIIESIQDNEVLLGYDDSGN